ncbi:hypothetical protein B0A55_00701 [Friedmanniomyces simplex]|uniref:Uncharacterized protein n=1 Tax=Friedmanniomyces simplex TaxID=329884 RepID=A0A4U0Y693_9PEZI|nr:hypothetical protein B0A55_00701 [Friedmanniomyces simplex]
MATPRPTNPVPTPENVRVSLLRRRAGVHHAFNNLFRMAMVAVEGWKKAEEEGKRVADEFARTKVALEHTMRQVELLQTEAKCLRRRLGNS